VTTATAPNEAVYGARKGNCNKCGEPGHHAWECKSRGGHATGAPTQPKK
jgi:hypothetical protein